jgi:hypothetical protein
MCWQIFGNVRQHKISRDPNEQLSGSYMQTDIREAAGGIIFAHFVCESTKTISDVGNICYFDGFTHRGRAGKTQSVYQGSAAWNRGSFPCTGQEIFLFSSVET